MSHRSRLRDLVNFMLLMMPFGLSTGFISSALGPHLKAANLSMSEVTAVISATSVPHMLKFLWAPVVDMTLTRKRWYGIGVVISAAGYFGLTLIPIAGHVPLLTGVVIVQSIGATLLGMALESLLAHSTHLDEKGKASGWFQAGSLGGAAIGGGAGLWLIDHLPAWQAGAILSGLALAFGVGLVWIDDVAAAYEGALGEALKGLLRDLWSVLSSRRGIIGVAMFIAPIGTGAISFAAAAADWNVSHGMLEFLNGWISAPIVVLGCILGGLLSDRLDRAFAYVAASLIMVAVTIAMALAPHTPAMYLTFVTAYTVTTGLTYGTYGGFVLDAAGTGAVATKYNILASFANVPIWYMVRGDGFAYDRWHANGMLWFDALCGLGGCVLVSGLILWFRQRPAERVATSLAS